MDVPAKIDLPVRASIIREMLQTGCDTWIASILDVTVHAVRSRRRAWGIPTDNAAKSGSKVDQQAKRETWTAEWRQKLAEAAAVGSLYEPDDEEAGGGAEDEATRARFTQEVIDEVDRRRAAREADAHQALQLSDKERSILVTLAGLPDNASLGEICIAARRMLNREDMDRLIHSELVLEVERKKLPPIGYLLTAKGRRAASHM